MVRRLTFKAAQLPEETEVRKDKQLPAHPQLHFLYLDSVDQLRKVSRTIRKAVEGTSSPEREDS